MQLTVGSHNSQYYVDIEKVVYSVKATFESVEDYFKKYDDEINAYFNNGIVYSKLKNVNRPFCSSKIFASLLKLGIPLEHAYQIVYDVVQKLQQNIMDEKYKDENLSTHEIRKIVADAILYCNLENVSIEEIELWGDKYVRRYGHDSQRAYVYFKHDIQTYEVGYGFIKKTLLPDIIKTLNVKDNTHESKIRKTQIDSFSEEILDFVNNCNMYGINYDILKEFVIEMALQPPHPWFVTEENFLRTSQYDLDILPKHCERLKESRKNEKYTELHYTICEALHHAASSILARYREVLGCNDLDAFYNLERIVGKLHKRKYKDLLVEKSLIKNIVADLKYIDVSLSDFYDLLGKIDYKLTDRKNLFNVTNDFVDYVLDFCDIAIKLGNNVDKERIELFLENDWNLYCINEKNSYIRAAFYSIDGIIVKNFLKKFSNCFWIDHGYNGTEERQSLVICGQDEIELDELMSYINSKIVKRFIDSIILILEGADENEKFEYIIQKLDELEYPIQIIDKSILKNMYYSENGTIAFNKIMQRGFDDV